MSRHKFSGCALKERRRRAGLQLEHVALAVGRRSRTIERYEAGDVQPSAEMVAQLARVIGVSPGDFYAAAEPETVAL